MQLLIQQSVLTNFRPVFTIMLVIALVFFVRSVIPQGRNSPIHFATVLTVSIIEGFIAIALFYTESQLVETFDLSADSLTMYLFFGIILFSVLNPVVFKLRNRQTNRYRYR